MRSPLPVLCALAFSQVVCGDAVEAQLLKGADFFNNIASGEKVWAVTFALDDTSDALARSAQVRELLPWLEVAWMDVGADADARLLADLHEVNEYPATVVFARGAVHRPAPADITAKQAVEKWLPATGTAAASGVARPLLADASDEAFAAAPARCVFGAADVRQAAAGRAAALRFWDAGVAFAADGAVDGGVRCTGEGGAEVAAAAGSSYAGLVAAVDSFVAPFAEEAAAAAAAGLEARRAAAKADMTEAILPRVSSLAGWRRSEKDSQGAVQTLFFLDSKADGFEAQRAAAAEVAALGGGKLGKKAPFSFCWFDASEESDELLGVFEVKNKKAGLPTLAFIVPVMQQDPSGKGEGKQVRALSVGPQGLRSSFNAQAIQRYIDNKLMNNNEALRPFDATQITKSIFSKQGASDETPESEEGEPLVYDGEEIAAAAGSAAEGGKDANKGKAEQERKKREQAAKRKQQQKQKAKKVQPKKEKSAKQLQKEEEEKARIAKELEEKKAAREQRIREKKEKEAAEKEAAAAAKAAKKGGKKKAKKEPEAPVKKEGGKKNEKAQHPKKSKAESAKKKTSAKKADEAKEKARNSKAKVCTLVRAVACCPTPPTPTPVRTTRRRRSAPKTRPSLRRRRRSLPTKRRILRRPTPPLTRRRRPRVATRRSSTRRPSRSCCVNRRRRGSWTTGSSKTCSRRLNARRGPPSARQRSRRRRTRPATRVASSGGRRGSGPTRTASTSVLRTSSEHALLP